MRWRLRQRRFVQPDYAAVARRRIVDDGIGDTLALGLFLLVSVIVLASTAVFWRDPPRSIKASQNKLVLSDKPRGAPFVRAAPKDARGERLAMTAQPPR